MPNQKNISLIIQAEPNALGVDYAHLALNDAVLQRLRVLYALLDAQKLVSLSTQDIPVHWIKQGSVLPYSSTVCEVFEGGLGVSIHILGPANAHGVFDQAKTVHGAWMLGDSSDLETASLRSMANQHGEIFAESLGLSFLDQVSNAALLQFASRRASRTDPINMLEAPSFAWPNPYDRWAQKHVEEPSSRRLLPRKYTATERTFAADTVLRHLWHFTTDADFDPNQRCALYTLAAALIICPKDVALLLIDASLNVPDFLLNPAQRLERVAHSTPLTDNLVKSHVSGSQSAGLCGTCLTPFPARLLTVRIVYANLTAELEITTKEKATFRALNTPHANLALLYEDHQNNSFAHQIFVAFSSKYTDDFSRLKMLAFGLDALKRLLEDEYPWYEDLRVSLESNVLHS